MSIVTPPLSIALAPGSLTLQWSDGTSMLPAALLRASCRCASCQTARLRGEAVDGGAATLVDALPVGHYALQLRFDDGHERGIYPWQALRELGVSAQGPSTRSAAAKGLERGQAPASADDP